MRSKAPLALIEQAVMLLVFALAAVLCLRAFVWADTASDSAAARDRALTEAQSAAEVLKSCKGDFEAAADLYGGDWFDGVWIIRYDEQWRQTDAAAAYVLRVEPQDSSSAYLGTALVSVWDGETSLVSLDLAWQEVAQYEP